MTYTPIHRASLSLIYKISHFAYKSQTNNHQHFVERATEFKSFSNEPIRNFGVCRTTNLPYCAIFSQQLLLLLLCNNIKVLWILFRLCRHLSEVSTHFTIQFVRVNVLVPPSMDEVLIFHFNWYARSTGSIYSTHTHLLHTFCHGVRHGAPHIQLRIFSSHTF